MTGSAKRRAHVPLLDLGEASSAFRSRGDGVLDGVLLTHGPRSTTACGIPDWWDGWRPDDGEYVSNFSRTVSSLVGLSVPRHPVGLDENNTRWAHAHDSIFFLNVSWSSHLRLSSPSTSAAQNGAAFARKHGK